MQYETHLFWVGGEVLVAVRSAARHDSLLGAGTGDKMHGLFHALQASKQEVGLASPRCSLLNNLAYRLLPVRVVGVLRAQRSANVCEQAVEIVHLAVRIVETVTFRGRKHDSARRGVRRGPGARLCTRFGPVPGAAIHTSA